MAAPAVDADLVAAAQAGDDSAFGRLFDTWFDPVFDHVVRIVHDRDLAGEVAQDAFLAAWQRLGTLEDPQAFGAWLVRIARNRALDRLAKERRATPVDDEGLAVIEAQQAAAGAGPLVEDRASATLDPERAAEDGELAELLWGAAEALGERDAGVLDLHLRHGLGATEIAGVLGVTPNNAHQMLFRLRGRLGGAVRARVLWRRGAPLCDGLAQALQVNGVERFDATAVRVIATHTEVCDDCNERQRTRLEPAVLFSAVPLLVAPVLFKAKAAAALGQAGVPMAGSAFTAVGAGGAGVPAAEAPTRAGLEPPTGVLHTPAGGPRHVAPGPRWGRWIGGAAAAVIALVAVFAWVAFSGDGDDPRAGDVEAVATAPASDPASDEPAVTSAPEASGAVTSAPTASATRRPSPQPTPSAVPTTPAPPPAGPRITSFGVESTGTADTSCTAGYAVVSWATTGATDVRLSVGTKTRVADASGEDTVCAASGTTVTLRASGEGGEVSDSERVP